VTETVITVDRGPRRIARQVLVQAPAAAVFALVADPHRHPELDGSGTVRPGPVTGPPILSAGARFTVGMKQYGAPYKITSTVTAFETDRLVEWQHPWRHRWRWELEEIKPGITEVTETFDYSTSRTPRLLEFLGEPGKNAIGITRTLQALQARFAYPDDFHSGP
jgi:Polyketide cyclase / dehydrase and lipid transport